MRLTVNGVEHELAGPPLRPLLHVLREDLTITSPKAGCQQGGCGACTVLVDGEPRRSCLLPLAAVDGAEILTVEGLGTPGRLAPVQVAFHEQYASQCGFCTPGFLIATHAYFLGEMRGLLVAAAAVVALVPAAALLHGIPIHGGMLPYYEVLFAVSALSCGLLVGRFRTGESAARTSIRRAP